MRQGGNTQAVTDLFSIAKSQCWNAILFNLQKHPSANKCIISRRGTPERLNENESAATSNPGTHCFLSNPMNKLHTENTHYLPIRYFCLLGSQVDEVAPSKGVLQYQDDPRDYRQLVAE
jgi:hypothetical protein